jgi:hypothetical protein
VVREVTVAHSDRERALVASGLSEGDLVIISSIDAVTDGMVVRVAGEGGDGNSAQGAVGLSDGGAQ